MKKNESFEIYRYSSRKVSFSNEILRTESVDVGFTMNTGTYQGPQIHQPSIWKRVKHFTHAKQSDIIFYRDRSKPNEFGDFQALSRRALPWAWKNHQDLRAITAIIHHWDLGTFIGGFNLLLHIMKCASANLRPWACRLVLAVRALFCEKCKNIRPK